MGLFGKMFQKKVCARCGRELGLTGWRSLEDGFLCKDCTGMLSPFFTGRKRSDTASILAQLDAREKNLEAVRAFQCTEQYGTGFNALCVDRSQGWFLIGNARNWRNENPDVLSVESVRECRLEVRESRSELRMRDKDGHMVSYEPRRYEYNYNIEVELTVDFPWFDNMTLNLGSSVSGDDAEEYWNAVKTGTAIQQALGFEPEMMSPPRPSDPLPPPPPMPHETVAAPVHHVQAHAPHSMAPQTSMPMGADEPTPAPQEMGPKHHVTAPAPAPAPAPAQKTHTVSSMGAQSRAPQPAPQAPQPRPESGTMQDNKKAPQPRPENGMPRDSKKEAQRPAPGRDFGAPRRG